MFRAFLILASIFSLVACGGGGNGDSYASTGITVSISPQTASIDVGQALPMRITGGIGPYRLVSSNPRVLPVPAVLDNIHAADVTVTTGEAYQTEAVAITVLDNQGQSASATITVRVVTVVSSPEFSSVQVSPSGGGAGAITAGQHGVLNITSNASYSVPRTITIQRLSGDYTLDNANVNGSVSIAVGSDHMALATLTVAAGAVTQTGKYRVTDTATGEFVEAGFQIASVPVLVPGPITAMSVLPATLSAQAIDVLTLTISGGTPPYAATATNAATATVNTVIGNRVTVTANAAGITEIVVSDAASTTTSAVLTVASTGITVAISPQTASINVGQALPMRITGGMGPYRLLSSNPKVLPVPAVLDNIHAADVTVTAGEVYQTEAVTITVLDNQGQSASATITVVSSPEFSSVQVSPSGGGAGAIAAGQRGVLNITSNASYSVPRTITIQRLSGDYTLDNADANGSVLIAVGSDHMALATLTVAAGAVTQTGKYRVTDTATGEFVEAGFQIASVSGPAPVPGPITTLSVLPVTLSAQTGDGLTLTITGGTPPYAAVAANSTVATVNKVIGNQVTVTANAAGITEIVVSDAASAAASALLTVN